jgi:prepilin-type N-terminal cleavage/methylation domain-containing protein
MPQQAPKNGRPENGFTLMEVMVALSVVAIALMAIYRMHTQTLFMDARGRFDTVAAMLARQKLADIDTTDLTDLSGDSGDFGNAHPGYAVADPNEDVARPTCSKKTDRHSSGLPSPSAATKGNP